MSRSSKDRKAKEKRRKGYQTSLEKACIHARAEMHKAVDHAISMQRQKEHMDALITDFLRRNLIVDFDANQRRTMYVKYQEEPWVFMNRSKPNYARDEFAAYLPEATERLRTKGIQVGFQAVIDELHILRARHAIHYLYDMLKCLTERMANHVLGCILEEFADAPWIKKVTG